jgi:filamentous hemagglutinin family protein
MRFALVACLFPLAAAANPTGGTVTSGSATISSSGSTVTVNTSTSGTVINWNNFSIGAGETTRFNQPSASSATLNRVTGLGSSQINGSLQSNGQVFLVNPNGIVFGSTASVNVAGFVASTLDITDADFLSGNLRFAASGPGFFVSHSGSIVGADYVALIGAGVFLNSGSTISAGSGGVAIASGDPVALTTSGGAFTSVSVGSNFPGSTVLLNGAISSPGPVIIQTGGGSSLPQHPIPLPPLIVVSPGTGTINQNPGTGGGVIYWTNFNIGMSSTITIAGTATVGSLTATTNTSGSGTVTIQASVTAAGPAPAVTTTGVSLNLEKREFSF